MKNHKTLFLSLIGGAVIFFSLLCASAFWSGGFGQLLAYINGEAIYVFPQTIHLGSCEAGKETVAVFHLTNLTSQEIPVIGERSSCTCTFSETIPITAPPGKTIELKINAHLPKYDSSFDQTVTLMIQEPKHLAMHPVRITATIPNPLAKPAADSNDAK
jgi:hypothetical protein